MKKNDQQTKTVLVAMSGGVDSSVATWLLKKRGFEVIGVFLNLGQVQYNESLAAAGKAARKIGIPLKVIDLRKKFRQEVIDYFLKSYAKGLTPNPCVVCNQKIKFEVLLKLAKKYKADFLATGHYVRLWRKSQTPSSKSQINSKLQIPNSKQKELEVAGYGLAVARDAAKDQSYFLYNLTQKQLERLLFPLGNYTKKQVKEIAEKARLPYLRKESQDICFLAGDHNEFLKQNLKLKKGLIVNTEKQIVGQHEGLPLYTLGQRRAIKIGGVGPFYAAGRDWQKNQLIVTKQFDDPILYSDKLAAEKVNWIAGKPPKLPFHCQVRIRYSHPLENCLVSKAGKNYLVKFSQKLRAITPGQSVVFYRDGAVLGGGVIVDEQGKIL